MSVHSPQRRFLRAGLASVLVGLGLAATGFMTAPVLSEPADPSVAGHQISICHADGNGGYSNPNPTAAQVLDDAHGHGLHLDDIIPPFPAGSQGAISWPAFSGRNWDVAGRAIYDSCSPCKTGTHDELGNCVTPDPVPEVCAQGQVGVFPDCVTPAPPVPEVCAQGQVGVFPDCVTPDPVPQVPAPVLVPPVMVSPAEVSSVEAAPASEATAEQPARRPIEVMGEEVLAAPAGRAIVRTAELPRTGTDAVRLVQLGVLLFLLGTGATLIGAQRRRAVPAVACAPAPRCRVDRTSSWLVAAVVGAALLGRRRRVG